MFYDGGKSFRKQHIQGVHGIKKFKPPSYLLLEQHGVDGLSAGQDHHGEAHSHRHHKAHTDHLRYQVRWKVHQYVPSNVICEAHITEEPYLEEHSTKHSVM